jgi:ClpP class serine protease
MIHSGPGSTFEVRAGQIGVLTLAGRIEEKTLKAALALVAGLSQLRGVLAIFDTPGGSGTCADLLREIVLFARDRVPVFALVRQACSAGLLIATACGHILAEDEDDSTMGCFGAIAHFCDGHTPQLLCSRQAPQKIPVGRLTMGPLNFSRYDEYEIEIQQNILDRHFDVNIARISQLRGVPIDVLLEIFTGETFTGRTAR